MSPSRPPREIPLVHLLPNAMTLGAICAGLTAMRMAVAGEFDRAVGFLVLAALLDGLDGRVARVLKSESLIGAELDSLADVVNFGAAPGIILYFWTLWQAPTLGWIAALVYVSCCALRLARFNVGAKGTLPVDKRFFTGVPSPAGALLALAPLFLGHAWPGLTPPPVVTAVWLVVTGFLMVSRLPTWSLKRTLSPRLARLALALVAVALIALALWPWAALFVADVLYLLTLPAALFAASRARAAPPS